MKKWHFLSIFLVMFVFPLSAQRSLQNAPRWISYEKRKAFYSDDQYIKGFVSETLKKGDDVDQAKGRLISAARTLLNESVLTEIKSITSSKIETENTETYEYFKQTSVSLTKLKISGLKTETFYDTRKRNIYAFAYAPKADVRDYYQNLIEDNNLKLKKLLETAADTLQSNKLSLLKDLSSGEVFIQSNMNAHSVLMALDAANKAKWKAYLDQTLDYKKDINNQIQKIINNKKLKAGEAQQFLVKILKLQLKDSLSPLWISNFSFENSGIVSPYSNKFAQSLTNELIKQGFRVTRNSKIPDKLILKGFFWEEKDIYRINLSVMDGKTGDVLAAVESGLDKSWVAANNFKIEPEKYNQAVKNMALFNQNLVTSNGGLTIAISTNKGTDNLLFQQDDTLKIYIKANKECYVRFIYHLADGNRVLLYDNYHITASLTNKVIELPQYFVCTEPYGVETLQLLAQTEEFKSLNIRYESGYKFIDGNLNTVLASSRGFKPVSNEDAKAEQYVMITTVPKSW